MIEIPVVNRTSVGRTSVGRDATEWQMLLYCSTTSHTQQARPPTYSKHDLPHIASKTSHTQQISTHTYSKYDLPRIANTTSHTASSTPLVRSRKWRSLRCRSQRIDCPIDGAYGRLLCTRSITPHMVDYFYRRSIWSTTPYTINYSYRWSIWSTTLHTINYSYRRSIRTTNGHISITRPHVYSKASEIEYTHIEGYGDHESGYREI